MDTLTVLCPARGWEEEVAVGMGMDKASTRAVQA